MTSFPMHHTCTIFDNAGISVNVIVDIEGVTKPEDLCLIDIDDIIDGLKTLTKYYQDLYDKKAREASPDLL